MLRPLNTYWNPGREDNFTTATASGRAAALAAGYVFVRNEGWLRPEKSGSAPQSPLENWWHPGRGDHFLTATREGQATAEAAGYVRVRVEGWVAAQGGVRALTSWWHSRREDNYTTARPEGEAAARNAGYATVRREGWLSPADLSGGLHTYWDFVREDHLTAASGAAAFDAAAAGYDYLESTLWVAPNEPNAIPLNLYYSDARGDNLTTRQADDLPQSRAAGYRLVRQEGRVFPDEASIPDRYDARAALRLYWSDSRGDHLLTGSEERAAIAEGAGYDFVRVEGYVATSTPP